MTKGWAALLLSAALPLVSGCVAAAIPLAAGAAMIGNRVEPAPDPAVRPVAEAPATSDTRVTRLALTELPPPDTATPFANDGAVAAFSDYVANRLAANSGSARPSALLTRASELRAERATCGAAPHAVFVDLDPGRGTFDPLAPGQPNRELGAALGDLRAHGVRVIWFSRLSSSFETAARTALTTSGLDPEGGDKLVLLRDLDERKQSRRDEEARWVCPIAMLGDERADFDELYLYLKQPDAAVALDAMIGRGWFLASPFAAAHPSTKDVVP